MSIFSRQILFALIAAIGFATPLAAETVVFNDDFSNDFAYSISYLNGTGIPAPDDNQADISTADFDILFGLENLDNALQLTHSHDVSRDDGGVSDSGDGVTFVQSSLKNQSVPYDPSVQGAFQSVTFSIDYFAAATDEFNLIYFAVGSAGLNGGGNFGGFVSPISDDQWHTYSFTGIQSDFDTKDFGGANELVFGFGFTSWVDVSDESESRQVLLDNFSVTVSSIPEPSTVSVSAIAGLALFCRRRRI